MRLLALAQPPIHMHASHGAAWFFTIWAGAIALAALPWSLWRLARKGDAWPLLMLASGVLASFNEPMLDHLGHLWYPRNLPIRLYTNFGVAIPLLVPLAYASFGGITGYAAYRRMQRGLTSKQVISMWLVLACADLVLEYPGVTTNVYRYYGTQPFNVWHYPWWWFPPAGTAMLMSGFLLWAVAPHLHGARKLLAVLVVPTGVTLTYFTTAWPTFLALNANVPVVIQWLAAVGTAALCAAVAWGVGQTVAHRPPPVPEATAADETSERRDRVATVS